MSLNNPYTSCNLSLDLVQIHKPPPKSRCNGIESTFLHLGQEHIVLISKVEIVLPDFTDDAVFTSTVGALGFVLSNTTAKRACESGQEKEVVKHTVDGRNGYT